MKPSNRTATKAEASKLSIRDRIGRLHAFREKFRGCVTLCTVLLSFLLYLVARMYSGHDDPAQLRFVENPFEPTSDSAKSYGQPSKPLFAGEDHDTAQRLRECGSLLIAASLSAFEEFRVNENLPADLGVMLTSMRKRSLLPPGIEIRNGALHSSLSELKLSYRSEPFSFEIIALPSEGVEGPAMLFRFPLPASGSNSVMYFESSSQQPLPAPFSTVEQLAAVGWNIRHWRGEALPLEDAAVRDLREQDAWLKTLTKGER